jgi:hypothetical protein
VPFLTVQVDKRTVAAVCCDDFHVVNARVSGSLVERQFATLELSASTHPEVGEGVYLLWLNELELQPGQVVTFQLLSEGQTIGTGRTIDELHPESDEVGSDPEKSIEECFRELRARPNLRAGYSFLASTPAVAKQASSTVTGEYSFSFGALWNWLRTERASVSLSTCTIDSVEFNTPSREHFREYIGPGQAATLRVDA